MPHNRQSTQRLENVLRDIEGVGEQKSEQLARRLDREAEVLEEAFELMAQDRRIQSEIEEMVGIGESTLQNIALFLRDAGYTVRYSMQDYLEARENVSEGWN